MLFNIRTPCSVLDCSLIFLQILCCLSINFLLVVDLASLSALFSGKTIFLQLLKALTANLAHVFSLLASSARLYCPILNQTTVATLTTKNDFHCLYYLYSLKFVRDVLRDESVVHH